MTGWTAPTRSRAVWRSRSNWPYYRRTNPVLAENARHTIGEVLAEPV
ncbi:hypothetical protein [Streptomyces sp. NPDC002176]